MYRFVHVVKTKKIRKYNNSQKGKREQGKITHARCFPELLIYTINLMVIFVAICVS